MWANRLSLSANKRSGRSTFGARNKVETRKIVVKRDHASRFFEGIPLISNRNDISKPDRNVLKTKVSEWARKRPKRYFKLSTGQLDNNISNSDTAGGRHSTVDRCPSGQRTKAKG